MIMTLARSLRQHKKGSVITICLSILEAAFEIIIPLCMSGLIDYGVDQGEMSEVWKYGIILIMFAILQLATGLISAKLCAKTSAGFAANLRQDMYDNVQTFSNIDKFSTASIVTRLTTDVNSIQNSYQMLLRMAIRRARAAGRVPHPGKLQNRTGVRLPRESGPEGGGGHHGGPAGPRHDGLSGHLDRAAYTIDGKLFADIAAYIDDRYVDAHTDSQKI